jgi:hypothetical protein
MNEEVIGYAIVAQRVGNEHDWTLLDDNVYDSVADADAARGQIAAKRRARRFDEDPYRLVVVALSKTLADKHRAEDEHS